MAINSIQSGLVKTLSGLGNNSSSIVPMAVKDTISNCAIVHTYKKEGGKDDARERAIEEFGTGVVWLFGIPTVKKIIDKVAYPALGLDSKLDPRILKDKKSQDIIKNAMDTGAVAESEKKVFESLKENNKVFKNFTNEQVYKGMFLGKFAIATGLSAFLLSKIIKYKQKTTNERIQKDLHENNTSSLMMAKTVNNAPQFKAFTSKKKVDNSPSFTGLKAAEAFMYNPICNTLILDGVITGTRLKEARHGEKKEVGLKEAFQIVFIYGLAKPIEKGFEALGKALKMPIGCDPKVIFDKDVKTKLDASKGTIKDLLESKTLKEDFFKLNPKNNPLVELLADNGTISTVKNKEGATEALSFLSHVDEGSLKKSLTDLSELSKHADKIKGIKAFKTVAVLGNVAIAAWAMGVLQPKVNILMRKFLNNGDNRNPAIVAQEKKMQEQYKNAIAQA